MDKPDNLIFFYFRNIKIVIRIISLLFIVKKNPGFTDRKNVFYKMDKFNNISSLTRWDIKWDVLIWIKREIVSFHNIFHINNNLGFFLIPLFCQIKFNLGWVVFKFPIDFTIAIGKNKFIIFLQQTFCKMPPYKFWCASYQNALIFQ